MNKVSITGKLTKDPKLFPLKSENKVVNFSISVESTFKTSKRTDYFNLTAWGENAEYICKNMVKGSVANFQGKLESHSFKKGELTQYITKVVVQKVNFENNKELLESVKDDLPW